MAGNMFFPIVTEAERRLPFYLFGVGCWHLQEHVVRPDGYPGFQWIQCHSGEGELLLAGQSRRIKPQQGIFLYPEVPHEYYGVEEPWEVDWIGFGGYQVESLVKTLGFESSDVFFVANADLVLAKMRRVLNIAQSDNQFKGLECSSLIYELLLDLFRYASKSNDDSVQQQYARLQPVFDYVENHYAQVVTLEALAGTIGVTPQHLCLLFKNILKIRPFEYLNQVRINKSKELMMSRRNLTTQDIAGLVGYESTSYFCAVFKRIEGISPVNFDGFMGFINGF